MSLDLALIGFKGRSTAARVFGTLRDQVDSATPRTSEVAIIEHLGHDRMYPPASRGPSAKGDTASSA